MDNKLPTPRYCPEKAVIISKAMSWLELNGYSPSVRWGETLDAKPVISVHVAPFNKPIDPDKDPRGLCMLMEIRSWWTIEMHAGSWDRHLEDLQAKGVGEVLQKLEEA